MVSIIVEEDKNLKKLMQYLFSLLAIGLGLWITPMTVMAAEATNIYVGNVNSVSGREELYTDTYYKTDATSGAITADGSATDYNLYVQKVDLGGGDFKYVLTMNNATIKGVDDIAGTGLVSYYATDIILVGENTVTAGKDADSLAIYVSDTLNISGNGILNATATSTRPDGALVQSSCAIYGSDINIIGGTVNATAGDADYASSGICGYFEVNISGAGTSVIAAGGDVVNGNSCGISSTYYDTYTEDDVKYGVNISGGTVVATAGKAGATDVTVADKDYGYSHGIGSRDMITITGGTVIAVGNEAAKNSYGIGCVNTLTLNGGSIQATADKAGMDSYGIGTYGNLDIGGTANIQATGGAAPNGNSYGIGIASDDPVNGLFNPSTTAGASYTPHEGGFLTVSGGDAVVEANGGEASKNSVGLGATENANIYHGAQLFLNGGDGTEGSVGLFVLGDLLIDSGANVQGTAQDSKTSVGVGVKGNNGIQLNNDGMLSGQSGDASAGDSMGIASDKGISGRNNSRLKGIGGSGENSFGIASFADIFMDSSTVEAQGGNATSNSFGVGSNGAIEYKDSNVNAIGGDASNGSSFGTGSDLGILIDGGVLILESGNVINGTGHGAGTKTTLTIQNNPDLYASGSKSALGSEGTIVINNSDGYGLLGEDNNGNNVVLQELSGANDYKEIRNGLYYQVNFDGDIATGNMEPIYGITGDTITLPDNGFEVPTGMNFVSWVINNTEYEEGDTFILEGNTTVKAKFESIIYTVVFDANGGTGTMESIEVESGDSITLPENGFQYQTENGYKGFIGWLVPGLDGMGVGKRLTVTSDMVIKAAWTEYTLLGISPSVFKDKEGTIENIVVKCDGEFNKFDGAEVNDSPIVKNTDYTVVEGSTILTLQEAYLKTLDAGTYTVTLLYNDGGEVKGTFVVEAADIVSPTQAPVEPTQAPVEPTQAPVEPTQAPVEPTQAPATPTQAPATPTQAPVAPTQAPATSKPAPVAPQSPAVTAAPATATPVPTAIPEAVVSPKMDEADNTMVWMLMFMVVCVGGVVVYRRKNNS